MIKIPIKCLTKYHEDSFLRPYFRPFILLLVKKCHTSRFPLEYLYLLKQLFEKLCFYYKFEILNYEFSHLTIKNLQIHQRVMPGISNSQATSTHSSNFSIIDNFVSLYETNIPQL